MKVFTRFATLGLLLFSLSVRAENGVTNSQVIIGAHTTESGPLGPAGAPYARGLAAYFDMINENGGINGRKIKFIRRDTQGLPPKTVDAVRELVENEKVFAIVGANGEAHTAVYKYLEEKHIPDLFIVDGANVYFDKSLKMVFPAYHSWGAEAKAVASYIAKTKKGSKVCFLITKDTIGEDYLNGAMEAFNTAKSDKITIGSAIRVERGGDQADSEVLQLKQEKCDVIMTSSYGNLAPSAINFAFDQGYKPLWAVHSRNVTSKFISLLNEGAQEGIISYHIVARERSLSKNKEDWAKFEALMKKHNVQINGGSLQGYVTGEIFAEALKRAGKNLTRESIVKAAESFKNWQCSQCLNPLNSSSTNHALFGNGEVLVIKNKEWHFAK